MDNIYLLPESTLISINYLNRLRLEKNIIIAFTASCFDLLHAGHTLMFMEAKKRCLENLSYNKSIFSTNNDIQCILVCALQTDPTIDRPEKNRPIQSYEERNIQLSSNRYVDFILEYSTESQLKTILTLLSPDVRILGDDYIGKRFTGDDLGIHILYCDRSHGYSSSQLRQRIYEAESLKRDKMIL